jgi:hypothetical protein
MTNVDLVRVDHVEIAHLQVDGALSCALPTEAFDIVGDNLQHAFRPGALCLPLRFALCFTDQSFLYSFEF